MLGVQTINCRPHGQPLRPMAGRLISEESRLVEELEGYDEKKKLVSFLSLSGFFLVSSS